MDPVVIIGAGPAGVSAALELSGHGVPVVVVEAQGAIGGLARTIPYRGAKFDVGPHRFFTPNQEIRDLWAAILGADFMDVDRLTRIFYRGKFFNYPISIGDTLKKVGPLKSLDFAFSYLAARLRTALRPREPQTFEDWTVDQFGRSLFEAFFRTYTEKVWGIPCDQIGAEWAAQRIKGLSLAEAVRNALFKPQEKAKTLVERFKFPRHGAGQMYTAFARRAQEQGAQVLLNTRAVRIRREGNRAVAVVLEESGSEREMACSHVLTSNPITEAALSFDPAPPPAVVAAARALRYRSHLCVNLLVAGELFPDNWIYVHAKEVALGRIANYANFSAQMRAPGGESPITVEYFQFPQDEMYRDTDDQAVIEVAKRELKLMGIVQPEQVQEGFVVRSPAAYPVLEIGHAPHLATIRGFLAELENVHPIGRAGMFKYNNQDHSIATGLLAARNILGANYDVWAVNIDAEYHEAAKAE